MDLFVHEFLTTKRYTKASESFGAMKGEAQTTSFSKFIQKRRRFKKLSFTINLDADFSRPKVTKKLQKRRREKLLEVDEIPRDFIKVVKSLGFSKADAPRLYSSKDDWTGLNTGGKVNCTEQGCNFSSKITSKCLFDHCQKEHGWRDYPCDFEGCQFISFSKKCFNQHRAFFHLKAKSTHFQHRKRGYMKVLTLLMAQWVDMETEKSHALSACWCVTTLFEADSRLLICRIVHREFFFRGHDYIERF